MNSFTRATSSSCSRLACLQPLDACVVLDQVVAVVAGVVGQRPQRQIGDARDDRVEEEPVVRDEDDRVRVAGQVGLEPVARVEIEVVGRLVEQQQVGPAEQQLRQREAHLPAARERVGRLLERRVGEAEPAEHGRDLQVDAVAVAQAEAILQIAVAVEHRVVLLLRDRRVAEARLDVVHLRLHLEQRLEGGARLLEDRSAAWVRPSCGR